MKNKEDNQTRILQKVLLSSHWNNKDQIELNPQWKGEASYSHHNTINAVVDDLHKQISLEMSRTSTLYCNKDLTVPNNSDKVDDHKDQGSHLNLVLGHIIGQLRVLVIKGQGGLLYFLLGHGTEEKNSIDESNQLNNKFPSTNHKEEKGHTSSCYDQTCEDDSYHTKPSKGRESHTFHS